MHLRDTMKLTARGLPPSDNTIAAYERTLARLLGRSGENLETLSRSAVAEFLAQRAREISHNSMVTEVANLRAVLGKCLGREAVDRLFVGVARYAEKPKERIKLTKAEASEFLQQVQRAGTSEEHAILVTLLHAGLRASEAADASLRDFQQGRLQLTRTKGGKPRTVYLDRDAAGTLRRWAETVEGPKLFHTSRREIHRLVARIGRGINVPDLYPHALRRSYASIAHQSGAPLAFIQRQLGHSDIRTTMRYIGVDENEAREFANGFSLVYSKGPRELFLGPLL